MRLRCRICIARKRLRRQVQFGFKSTGCGRGARVILFGGLLTPSGNGGNIDSKWRWAGIVLGRYGSSGALICFRGGPIEVGINRAMSAIKIFDFTRRFGALLMNLTTAKYANRCLVGPRTLVFLKKTRSWMSKINITSRANTDTTVRHIVLFKGEFGPTDCDR